MLRHATLTARSFYSLENWRTLAGYLGDVLNRVKAAMTTIERLAAITTVVERSFHGEATARWTGRILAQGEIEVAALRQRNQPCPSP